MPDRLLTSVIEGIREKKGKNIVTIDLSKLDNSICDYFVICHGDSNTQVGAIAGSIQEIVKKNHKKPMLHKEGLENSEWVLMDYGYVVVHIFQQEIRERFKLEELWADAELVEIDRE